MKRFLLYSAIIAALFYLYRTLNILLNDLPRLTSYGYGYLVGSAFLFALFTVISILLFRSLRKPGS